MEDKEDNNVQDNNKENDSIPWVWIIAIVAVGMVIIFSVKTYLSFQSRLSELQHSIESFSYSDYKSNDYYGSNSNITEDGLKDYYGYNYNDLLNNRKSEQERLTVTRRRDFTPIYENSRERERYEYDCKCDCKEIGKMLIAVTQMRDNIREGRAFSNQLDELRELSGNQHPIQKKLKLLDDSSSLWSINLIRLQKDFDLMSEEVMKVRDQFDEDENITNKLYASLQKVIKVKKIGKQKIIQNNTELTLNRAKQFLMNNEIPKSINELEKLDYSRREVAKTWVDEAVNYIRLNEIAKDIYIDIVQVIK
jgi:hypothetical protein